MSFDLQRLKTISQKIKDTVFGYIRSLNMKYYMDDITYIILVYYGDAEKYTEKKYRAREKRKKKGRLEARC